MAKKDVFKLAYELIDRIEKNHKEMVEKIRKLEETIANDPEQRKKATIKKKASTTKKK